jgi:hypothetical protein
MAGHRIRVRQHSEYMFKECSRTSSDTRIKIVYLEDTTKNVQMLEGHKGLLRKVTWHPVELMLVSNVRGNHSDSCIIRSLRHHAEQMVSFYFGICMEVKQNAKPLLMESFRKSPILSISTLLP